MHAGTAVVGVGVLGSWCGLLREEVPKPLLEHLKVWREGGREGGRVGEGGREGGRSP